MFHSAVITIAGRIWRCVLRGGGVENNTILFVGDPEIAYTAQFASLEFSGLSKNSPGEPILSTEENTLFFFEDFSTLYNPCLVSP